MKLNKLTIANFQGITNAVYKFDGKSADIYGDNATGKTTLFNAFTWILFDKPSTGAKSFSPKPRDGDGDKHYLNTTVEAVFSDGVKSVTFGKDYHEVWKQKRGNVTEDFAGHEVSYTVNGVPTTEREYQAAIVAHLGDTETLKILTMPEYFSETMSWQDRRALLLTACGDMDDRQIITSTPSLNELPKYLKMADTDVSEFYTVEDYRKIATAQMKNINADMKGIPARIDEANRAKPSTGGMTIDEINAEYAELADKKAALTDTSKYREIISQIDVRIDEAKETLLNAKTEYNNRNFREAAADRERSHEYDISVDKLRNAVSMDKENLRSVQYEVSTMTAAIKSDKSELAELKSKKPNAGFDTCPVCKRKLDEADITKIKTEFSAGIKTEIQRLQTAIAQQESELAGKTAEAETLENTLKLDEARLESVRAEQLEFMSVKKECPPFETTNEYQKLISAATELTVKKATVEAEAKAKRDSNSAELEKIQFRFVELDRYKYAHQTISEQDKRIAELKAREKELAKEYEKVQMGLYLCEEFTKQKVSMLTDKINKQFKSLRFRLFQDQINGGLKDDCEVLIPTANGDLIPYSFANHAARLNAGLEIIGVFSRYADNSMPIFIDNAESVTHLSQTDTQVIRLIVSEPDKKLRVELK